MCVCVMNGEMMVLVSARVCFRRDIVIVMGYPSTAVTSCCSSGGLFLPLPVRDVMLEGGR